MIFDLQKESFPNFDAWDARGYHIPCHLQYIDFDSGLIIAAAVDCDGRGLCNAHDNKPVHFMCIMQTPIRIEWEDPELAKNWMRKTGRKWPVMSMQRVPEDTSKLPRVTPNVYLEPEGEQR